MTTPRLLILFQALILVCASTFSTAHAAVISTPDYVAQSDRQDQLARVNAALARDDVRQQLEHFGVAPEEAQARVAALSPAELQQLNNRMANMPAGSGVLGLIGAVFVVLLILELLGVTNVFSKF